MILSKKSIIKIFSFLETDYNFKISNIEAPGFNGIVIVTYTHKTFFDIILEQERGFLCIKCNVNQELVPLHLVYQHITNYDYDKKTEYKKRNEVMKGISDVKKYLDAIRNSV